MGDSNCSMFETAIDDGIWTSQEQEQTDQSQDQQAQDQQATDTNQEGGDN